MAKKLRSLSKSGKAIYSDSALRQGVPTSLPKCVFEGGEVWARTFAALYPKVSYADKV